MKPPATSPNGLNGLPQYSCDKCPKKFASTHGLWHHKNAQHDPSGANSVKCTVCDKWFACKAHLRNHSQIHKSSEERRKWTCSICPDKIFVSCGGLRMHMLRRHGSGAVSEPPHECSYCKKRFWASGELNSHIMVHTGERPHSCDECGATFRFNHKRDRHVRIRHRTGEAVDTTCSICNKLYSSKSAMRQHIKRQHIPHKKEKLFSCTYCDKTFASSKGEQSHVRTHTGEKPYQCPHCSVGFAQLGHRNRHVATVHQTKLAVEILCPVEGCAKRFKCGDYLKRHLLLHTAGRPLLQCENCGKTYKSKRGLQFHRESHHEDHGQHCTYCGKHFATLRQLRVHIRIHTGEKPFICEQCGKGFPTSGNLRHHLETHKMNEERRIFACTHATRPSKVEMD